MTSWLSTSEEPVMALLPSFGSGMLHSCESAGAQTGLCLQAIFCPKPLVMKYSQGSHVSD